MIVWNTGGIIMGMISYIRVISRDVNVCIDFSSIIVQQHPSPITITNANTVSVIKNRLLID
jgi:hypothetical protein